MKTLCTLILTLFAIQGFCQTSVLPGGVPAGQRVVNARTETEARRALQLDSRQIFLRAAQIKSDPEAFTILWSDNLQDWAYWNGTGAAVYRNTLTYPGNRCASNPHLFYSLANVAWYCVFSPTWTNAYGTSWADQYKLTLTNKYPIIRSTDLTNWTFVAFLTADATNFAMGDIRWFEDPSGDVYLMWSQNYPWWETLMYSKASSADLTTWGTPAAFNGATGIGLHEPTMQKVGSWYYLAASDCTDAFVYTNSAFTGTWRACATLSNPDGATEGLSIFPVNNKWIKIHDVGSPVKYWIGSHFTNFPASALGITCLYPTRVSQSAPTIAMPWYLRAVLLWPDSWASGRYSRTNDFRYGLLSAEVLDAKQLDVSRITGAGANLSISNGMDFFPSDSYYVGANGKPYSYAAGSGGFYTSSGKVGIGTNAPQTYLHIAGSGTNGVAAIQASNVDTNRPVTTNWPPVRWFPIKLENGQLYKIPLYQ